MSIRIKLVAFAATLLLLTGSQSQAAFVGSQGFLDAGTPLAGGSPTGNIDTAPTLTIGDLRTSFANGTGLFSGVGTFLDLGGVTFSTTLGANTSFHFGDTNNVFGSFTSISISSIQSGNGTESFFILGFFTPGTYSGYGQFAAGQPQAGQQLASVTVTFNQTPAGGGAGSSISDSISMAVPPAGGVVPEPASFAMVAIGLGGIFAVGRFRRRAA